MTFLKASEISEMVGGTCFSCTTVDTPLEILSCISFSSTGGRDSSVALIVNRTICRQRNGGKKKKGGVSKSFLVFLEEPCLGA